MKVTDRVYRVIRDWRTGKYAIAELQILAIRKNGNLKVFSINPPEPCGGNSWVAPSNVCLTPTAAVQEYHKELLNSLERARKEIIEKTKQLDEYTKISSFLITLTEK